MRLRAAGQPLARGEAVDWGAWVAIVAERAPDVDWFRRLFSQPERSRGALVCYLRENGPIAYGTEVFGADPRERVEALLESTALTWYWKATGADPGARDWTHLTRWSLAALLADLAAERNGSKFGILVTGVDDTAHDGPQEVTDALVAEWMRRFAADAPGPLHAVVSRPAAGSDLFFVAQQPPEIVRALLQAWGIGRDRAQRKAYARLHGSALEDLARSLAPRA